MFNKSSVLNALTQDVSKVNEKINVILKLLDDVDDQFLNKHTPSNKRINSYLSHLASLEKRYEGNEQCDRYLTEVNSILDKIIREHQKIAKVAASLKPDIEKIVEEIKVICFIMESCMSDKKFEEIKERLYKRISYYDVYLQFNEGEIESLKSEIKENKELMHKKRVALADISNKENRDSKEGDKKNKELTSKQLFQLKSANASFFQLPSGDSSPVQSSESPSPVSHQNLLPPLDHVPRRPLEPLPSSLILASCRVPLPLSRTRVSCRPSSALPIQASLVPLFRL